MEFGLDQCIENIKHKFFRWENNHAVVELEGNPQLNILNEQLVWYRLRNYDTNKLWVGWISTKMISENIIILAS